MVKKDDESRPIMIVSRIAARVTGPHPERLSYYPDGNGWLLQEVAKRLAGRVAGGHDSRSEGP